DFPLGGLILDTDGLRTAYETGRGAITVRARVQLETSSPKRPGLLVTELPYLVGPERVIEKIKDLVASKRITSIANVVDLTDRFSGMRLLIELKPGTDPESALSELYSLTPLQENFNVNMVALVEGQPRQLTLKEVLLHYLEHRYRVVVRRSKNRLELKLARLHLLDGLKVAVVNLDEVIRIIRQSETVESARQALMTQFELSEPQAEFILELRLRRLTRFSLIEIAKEANGLEQDIAKLQELLESEEAIRELVGTELSEIALQFGSPRRSEIRQQDATDWLATTPHLDANSGQMVGLDFAGLPARSTDSAPLPLKSLHSDGSGPWIGLTQSGEGVKLALNSFQIPKSNDRFVDLCELSPGTEIYLVAADGKAKRTTTPSFKRSRHGLIRAPQGAVALGRAIGELVLVSTRGRAIRFEVADLPLQGATSAGVAGINLAEGERVAAAICIEIGAENSNLEITLRRDAREDSNEDYRKALIALDTIPVSKRARRGVQLLEIGDGEHIFAMRLVAPGNLS
ncbi:MAG: hypothetical protein RL198_437, partial [Actinomycetota bacterium]